MALTGVRTTRSEFGPGELVARWPARPRLAVAAGVTWYVAHVGASLAITSFVAHAIPAPRQPVATIVWVIGLAAVAAVSLEVSQRVARRLLTLRALLRLDLAFPDTAPSRFALALRAGSPHQLDRRLEEVQRAGLGATPDAAAVTLLELVAALSAHDRQTRGHSERVRAYTELIAEELGLDRAACEGLRWGGLIHDVGKLRVPAEILNKPGSLAPEEWEVIRRHPRDGAELAAPMSGWLGEWADAVLDHHERWEGGGYPRGLAGSDISLAGRIVAVADAFDVMTSPRTYQRPRPHEEARAELERCAGSHFDPLVVRAFLNLSIRKIRGVIGPMAWLAHWPVFEWRVVHATRRAVPAATLALLTSVAAVTAPVSSDPVGAAAVEHPGSQSGASAPSAGGTDHATAAPAVGGPASLGLPRVLGLAEIAGNLDAHPGEEAMGARDSLHPPSPGDDGGGEGDGGQGGSEQATLTIDPSEGSVEVEDLGRDDTDLPTIELTPAGVVLCDAAGVCEPITIPLPLV